MNRFALLVTMLISILILAGCGADSYEFFESRYCLNCCNAPRGVDHLLKENWPCKIHLNPNDWVMNADSWFLNGKPNALEKSYNCDPVSKGITTSTVQSSNFTNISANGSFQLQIVGEQKRNSVTILGPNCETRSVAVKIFNNTLYLDQIGKGNLSNTIVRIGVCKLCSLVNTRCHVYGRNINSPNLTICSSGCGNIMLVGPMNVISITHLGSGTINLFGIISPALCLKVIGNGCVNLSGHIGIQSIVHNGNGQVNILGADSDCLTICASGCGTTTVSGFVKLKKLIAGNSSQVYVSWVNSCELMIYESARACVGIAGSIQDLYLTLKDKAYLGGTYLKSQNAYARLSQTTHANLQAQRTLFADLSGNSSVYFFGANQNISSNLKDNGKVITLNMPCEPFPPLRPLPWNDPSTRFCACDSD